MFSKFYYDSPFWGFGFNTHKKKENLLLFSKKPKKCLILQASIICPYIIFQLINWILPGVNSRLKSTLNFARLRFYKHKQSSTIFRIHMTKPEVDSYRRLKVLNISNECCIYVTMSASFTCDLRCKTICIVLPERVLWYLKPFRKRGITYCFYEMRKLYFSVFFLRDFAQSWNV